MIRDIANRTHVPPTHFKEFRAAIVTYAAVFHEATSQAITEFRNSIRLLGQQISQLVLPDRLALFAPIVWTVGSALAGTNQRDGSIALSPRVRSVDVVARESERMYQAAQAQGIIRNIIPRPAEVAKVPTTSAGWDLLRTDLNESAYRGFARATGRSASEDERRQLQGQTERFIRFFRFLSTQPDSTYRSQAGPTIGRVLADLRRGVSFSQIGQTLRRFGFA